MEGSGTRAHTSHNDETSSMSIRALGVFKIVLNYGECTMKNSTKHLIVAQVALACWLLAGCSSVKTTQDPTVRDIVGKVTHNDTTPQEPSEALVGYSTAHSPVRSNSVWTSRRIVTEPIAQGVQGTVLQADDTLDVKPTHPSRFNKRATTPAKRPYHASPRRPNVLVGDALKEVFGSSHTINEVSDSSHTVKESVVMDAVVQVIGSDNKDKEQPAE